MEVVNVDTTSEKFDNEAVFALIRISLWQEAIPMPDETDWQYLYDFFDTHALLALPADHLKELGVPEEIYARWKKEIYRYVCHNGLITQVQDKVVGCLRGIPVAVIKGTSAARYYPVPDYRTLGDVDLLVKPEDYDDAAKKIKAAGYAEVTGRSEKKTGRHRSFSENNIRVELHRHFSVDRLPEKVKTLDERLLCALKPDDPVLPDELNGLIILTHVAQHMESGIGLRQIIDWMLFVDKYLDDAHWENGFCALTESVGLTKFAKYVTRMCQLYLGLSDGITWCLGGVENTFCDAMMDYILSCGNFGTSRSFLESDGVSRLPEPGHPIRFLRHLQLHGERNWKTLRKHPGLKPFAWLYQLCRYIRLAIKERVGIGKAKEIFRESKKRKDLFTAIGLMG